MGVLGTYSSGLFVNVADDQELLVTNCFTTTFIPVRKNTENVRNPVRKCRVDKSVRSQAVQWRVADLMLESVSRRKAARHNGVLVKIDSSVL